MRIIGAIYDSGNEAIMNTPDTPIKISKRTIDAKGSSEGKKRERNKRQQFFRAVSIFLFVLLISFAAVLVKAYFDGEFRSVAALQKYIGRYGAFGPVFLAAFQAIQVVVPVLPGFLGCAAGSVMFGPAVGFWCNYIGIGGGSIIAFFLARKYGMPLLDDLFSICSAR